MLPNEIAQAMKSGNAKLLSEFFNLNIELEVNQKDDIYSKVQAEIIMKDFFYKYHPTDFIIKFEGGKDSSQYTVGSLITVKGNFRINFLFKNNLIQQLRIENQ